MKIAGKVALITGGTGGLGKAFAKALLNGNAAAVSNLELDFIVGLFISFYVHRCTSFVGVSQIAFTKIP